MQLTKLIAMRDGHRRLISRELERFDSTELTGSEYERLLHMITEETEEVKVLNDKIINHNDTEDLATELVESKTFVFDLDLKIQRLRDNLKQRSSIANTQPVASSLLRNENNNGQPVTSGEQRTTDDIQPELLVLERRTRHDFSTEMTIPSLSHHRLPKMSLPTFHGDVVQWQTFWDSFECSVHLNNTLSDVQKFTYLRSLVDGAAGLCIAGFQLTNANYKKAVDLLKQRFGQPDKIVEALIQALIQLDPPMNTPDSLQSFYDHLETKIRGLESLGERQESYGNLLVPIIRDKLPAPVRQSMARDHGGSRWQLSNLRCAIEKEIAIMREGELRDFPVSGSHMPTASFHTGSRNPGKKSRPWSDTKRRKSTCHFWDGEHLAADCNNFKTTEARSKVVKQKKLCFNCLSDSHQVSLCQSHNRCRNCQRKHHTAICEQKKTSSSLSPNATPFQGIATGHTILHSSTQARSNVLLKTAIVQVSSLNLTVEANILFDEGAQRSFITEKLANELHVKETGTETIYLAAFGHSSQDVKIMKTATVHVITDRKERIPIDALITPTIAVPMPSLHRHVASLTYLRGLKLAHPVTADETFEIDMLIGADTYWKIVQNHVVRGNGPTAVQSKLGYLLSGPLPTTNAESTHHMLNVMTSPLNAADIERFWKLESIGIAPETDATSGTDELQTYMDTCITYKDNQYSVKLPWKEDHPQLPTNYDVSVRRTQNMIQRLRREPFMFQKYDDIITEQHERGFIEVVDEEIKPEYPVHYIPHHGVRKESMTTPIRIVYDCSCRRSSNEPSLNDCLRSTPLELNDQTGILMRFRMNRYAVTTDIEKAFLHVALDERDRDVTRFLWLRDPRDPDSPLMTYRFKAVLFGATCSPFILCATIVKHLDNNKDNWVSDHVRRDIYVDNIISGFQQESDVVKFYHDTRDLMSAANFNLRSWNSNSRVVRDSASVDGVLDTDRDTKILGLRWNAVEDTLCFPTRDISLVESVTKREILQHISKIYDPLGILTPVTIRAKALLQELWKLEYSWDTPLSRDLYRQWCDLATDLNTVTSYSVNRYLLKSSPSEKNENISLQVFCDASMTSYGAAVFVCTEHECALVMAKSRVAPLKTLTLPRLELMAAIVGARLAKHVQKELNIERLQLWTDSQIVLHWLASTRTLPRFVKNRVTEIITLLPNHAWRYCPSQDNPADLLTRGISAEQFMTNDLWFKGPSWVTDPGSWPTWEPKMTTVCVTETCCDSTGPAASTTDQPEAVNGVHKLINIENYGNLQRLLRVTAYVLRFIKICRDKSVTQLTSLTSSELLEAEKLWISSCQLSSYVEEIQCIRNGTSRATLVNQLKLFIDDTGLLRCGGRIHNAPVAQTTKFPYLLPQKHTFTLLVIRDAHERILHSGPNSTISYIRQKYWIPAIRRCVQHVLRKCVTCRRVVGKAYTAPDPPPLPVVRVQDADPFTVTGVDFSGALYVRDTDGRNAKAYICLFTCASTRAVHLELVPDLSTETFIQAFRRFCSRRSVPRVMISDNGTTYVGAANHVKNLFASDKIHAELSSRGTEWRFIIKRAPWYGGWWERLIGITKTYVKKVLGRSCVDYQTLFTVITEIEAVINDRPLTYISTSQSDMEPLTPSHLISGRRITMLPHVSDVVLDTSIVISQNDVSKRARLQRKLIDDFRSRWRHEYLTALREHQRISGRNEQTIKVGDVVMVHDEGPRSRWRLARVQALIPGNDGRVRAADIRTDGGVTNRPITKLYPLEVGGETNT